MTIVWVTMFQIDSLTATIKQLELERGQLYDSLKEQRHLSDNLSVKVADLQEDVIRKCKLLSQFCWEPGMLDMCHCGKMEMEWDGLYFCLPPPASPQQHLSGGGCLQPPT